MKKELIIEAGRSERQYRELAIFYFLTCCDYRHCLGITAALLR